MSDRVVVTREGDGPEVLFVHGGATAATTWRGLEALTRSWTLAYVHRRGYAPSPPVRGGRMDFDLDADDLEPLLDGRPHVVAHSYGTLGALIAAGRRPHDVASITIIEPPLFHLGPGDPEVERLEYLGNACLTHGLDADPAELREFLRLAGAPVDDGPLSEQVKRGVRRAHGNRSPSEARPPLAPLRAAGVPALAASGGHYPAMERICDALARELRAARVVAPGAGHFVAAAAGFADQLDVFLREAETRRTPT